MNVWKRALLYLRRNAKRCVLLVIILTTIASTFMVCLSVLKSTQNGIDDLRKSYGNAFSMEISFTDSSKEDSSLWERKINEQGLEEYHYKGPALDDTTIKKVMSIKGVEDVCKAQETTAHFGEIDFIPGLFADVIKIDKKENSPELYNTIIISRDNTLRGYSQCELSSYFRTNAFELTEGKYPDNQDKNKIMISDALAKRNDLALGDIIHAEVTDYTVQRGNPKHVHYETDFKIVGIFHVNINQIVSEYTAEPDIAENFMIADIDTVREVLKAYYKVINLNKEPSYQKATFFIDDPKEMTHILEKIQKIEDVDWNAFKIERDDVIYQSALTPLQNISKITVFMLVFIIAVCIIMLTLILRMWIGTRKKEMGILLSMGNGSRGIISQLILEEILLLSAALIISCAVSAGASNGVGNMMLSGVNAQEERKTENAEKNIGAPPAAAEDVAAYNEQFTVKTEVEAPKEIDCRITAAVVVITAGVMVFVLVFITVITAGKTLKMKPKEILSML